MQVIRWLQVAYASAVLLFACKAVVAAPTNSRAEAYADQPANLDGGIALRDALTQSDDAAGAFMATDVRQLNSSDGFAISSRCIAGARVEICGLSESNRPHMQHVG